MRASDGKSALLKVLGLVAASLALRPSDVGAQLMVGPSEPPSDASNRDRYDVINGDTLSSVAERYLGSADAWPKLGSYNPEITNPHYIYPGYVLRLKEGVDLGDGQSAAVLAQAAVPAPGTPRGTVGLRRTNRPTLQPSDRVVRIGDQVYLDREALATAGKIAGSGEDHLMLSPTDTGFLQFKDASQMPAPGREVTVFIRMHKAEVSP